MKMRIYCVYDRVAEESMPLFESRNDATALRSYQKHVIEKNDIDEKEMMLLCVGIMDHDTNRIEAFDYAVEITPRVSMVDQLEEEDGESI